MTYDEVLKLESITFDVTQDDINKGYNRNCTACPIARAINRTLGLEACFAFVSGRGITHPIKILDEYPGNSLETNARFSKTKEIAQFIFDFDSRLPVEPATFTIKRVAK